MTEWGEPTGLYNIFCPVCGIGTRWHEGCDRAKALGEIEAFFETHAEHQGFSRADRPWIGFLRARPLISSSDSQPPRTS